MAFKAHPDPGGIRKCNLCFTEKLIIMKAEPKLLLKMHELFPNAGTLINSH